jgi:hypothetical protein
MPRPPPGTRQGVASIVVYDPVEKFVKALGTQHRKGDRGVGHGIDIRKEGGEEFLYLWPNDSSMAFTKMTMSGEIVWQKGLADLRSETGHYTGRPVTARPTSASRRTATATSATATAAD